jgi:hypothetical protein
MKKKKPIIEYDLNMSPLEMIEAYTAERDRLTAEQDKTLSEIKKILTEKEKYANGA